VLPACAQEALSLVGALSGLLSRGPASEAALASVYGASTVGRYVAFLQAFEASLAWLQFLDQTLGPSYPQLTTLYRRIPQIGWNCYYRSLPSYCL